MPPKQQQQQQEPQQQQRKPREWGHPEGMPLEEVDDQMYYSGVVTNVSVYGVFVDFGAVKDGLLKVERKYQRTFRKGMQLDNLVVEEIDLDTGKVLLQPDPDSLEEPPPRPPRSRSAAPQRSRSVGARGAASGRGAGGAARRAASQGRPGSRPPRRRRWDHDEAIPLEELQLGDVFDGVVTNVSPSGVFVDIGAVRDARLSVPAKIGKRFRIGDEVKDCSLEVLDLDAQRMAVSIPDPEEAVKDLPPKERPAAKSAGQGKAKAKAKPKPKAAQKPQAPPPIPEPEGGFTPIEDLVEGNLCDGVVNNKNQFGVFVNIGCQKAARLNVPKKLASQFRKGDEVYGMRIERVDLEKNQITVSIEDPELSADEEEEPQAPAPPPPAPKQRAAPASAKPSASAPSTASAKTTKAKAKAPVSSAPASTATTPAAQPASARPKAKTATQDKSANMPTARFRAGMQANGIVTGVVAEGVCVKLGSMGEGLLKLPRSLAEQFMVDDEVRGMNVEGWTEDRRRLLLSLDDPELLDDPALMEAVDPPAPRPKQKKDGGSNAKASAGQAKAQARSSAEQQPRASGPQAAGQPKSNNKAKAAANDWSHPGALEVMDIQLGSVTSGTVTSCGGAGVFVDIGAVKDGKLRLPRGEWRRYRVGDQVEGLLVHAVDPQAETISLLPPDEEDEDEDEDDLDEAATMRPPLRQAPRTTSRGAGKSGAVDAFGRQLGKSGAADAFGRQLGKSGAAAAGKR